MSARLVYIGGVLLAVLGFITANVDPSPFSQGLVSSSLVLTVLCVYGFITHEKRLNQ